MICGRCDSPDCGFMGTLGTVHWYRCQACGWDQAGPEPVCVDFTEADGR